MRIRQANVHITLRRFFVSFVLLQILLLPVHPDPAEMDPRPLIGCAVTVPVIVYAQILMWRKEIRLVEAAIAAIRAVLTERA